MATLDVHLVSSAGGNAAADADKLAQFGPDGSLNASTGAGGGAAINGEASALNTPGVQGYATGGGEGGRFQATTGDGVNGSSTSGTAIRGTNGSDSQPPLHVNNTDPGHNAPLAYFHNVDGQGVEPQNDGAWKWTTATGAANTRGNLGLGNVDNTSDVNKPVSTAQASAIAAAVMGVYHVAGAWDASVGTFPITGTGVGNAVRAGDVYRVSVAGTIGGQAYDVGDNFYALIDTPGQTASNWSRYDYNTEQANETTRGTLAVATQAEIEDTASTNDIDAVTPVKFWQGVARSIAATIVQGYNAFTAAIAAMGAGGTVGVLEKTAANTAAIRSIGVANATDLLTRAGGDGRYAPINFPVVTEAGTTRTLALTDGQTMIDCTSSTPPTITIPPESDVAWVGNVEIAFRQAGTGQLTIAAGLGVTLTTDDSTRSYRQYSVIGIKRMGTNSWTMMGKTEF